MSTQGKTALKNAGLWTIAYLAIAWFLIPAGGCWLWGQYSLLRLDPRVSKDYNCIFVEGHSRESFNVPWFRRSTPIDRLRLRYTPHADRQSYGIMFIDPKTLAYEAHEGWASAPMHLSGKLDSPKPILNWIRSQPHSTQADAHVQDAQEIYAVIRAVAPGDLEHFVLPNEPKLQNFLLGHKSLADPGRPKWSDLIGLIPLWLGLLAATKSCKGTPASASTKGCFRQACKRLLCTPAKCRRLVWITAGTIWAAPLVVLIHFFWRMARGDYPFDADAIAIPIFSYWIFVFPFTLVLLISGLRGYVAGAFLLGWNTCHIGRSIVWTVLMVFPLGFSTMYMILDGLGARFYWVSVFFLLHLYCLLLLRACVLFYESPLSQEPASAGVGQNKST